tara:strand:+ start:7386 stop:7655 length:270 start_codon:yes stop_codon:yes gene_type:complete
VCIREFYIKHEDVKKVMINFSPEKIGHNKVFHIYLKSDCVMHNLSEDKFKESWEILNTIVGFMKTDYSIEDLTYEAVEETAHGAEESSY